MMFGPFGKLPKEAQEQLTAVARVKHWARGELLFHPHDPAETLLILTQGNVRLYRLGADGREVTLDVHGPGHLLGVSTLRPDAFYGMYAEAMDDTETLVLGRETLTQLIGVQPSIGIALAEQVARQTRGVQERVSGLVFMEVSQRLALALLSLTERKEPCADGGHLALLDRVSHQQLAHMVGSTRETITKLLGDFRKRGLLDLGYRHIIVTDRMGLTAASREPLR